MAVGLFAIQSQAKMARLMQYRGDFALGVLLALAFSIMPPLFQLLVYTRSQGFPGWEFEQVLVFQAALILTTGMKEFLFGDVRKQIEELVEKGAFDQLLLKPFPPLLLLLASGFSPYAAGTLLLGCVALAGAWLHADASIDVLSFAAFLVLLAAGALISLSASILYCALTVRWTYPLRLGEAMDKVLRFGEFPLEVYPMALRTLFLTALPFSVATYWPAQALLGRLTLGAPIAAAGAVGLVCAVTWFWGRQLRRYSSAGG